MEFELVVQDDKPKRDEIWDALLESCGIDPDGPFTSSARGAYNRAVAQMRRVRATPADVRTRADVYRVRFPRSPLTPSALCRHYAELKPARKARNSGDGGAYCDVCGELRWMPGTGRMECRCEA